MAVEFSELRLVWPPELFAAEGRALLADQRDRVSDVGYLLDEAFHGHRAYRLYTDLDSRFPRPSSWDDPWDARPADTALPRPTMELLGKLVREAADFPRYAPRSYYSKRNAPPASKVELTEAQLRAQWAMTVADLVDGGYFEDAFGSTCPDSGVDYNAEGALLLQQLLHVDSDLWPMRVGDSATGIEQCWNPDLFLDMVEALDDLVARPRTRDYHSFHDGWDYGDYARAPGRAVYRWRVNELFDKSEVRLRLTGAADGSGELTFATRDPRDELADEMPAAAVGVDRDEIGHAVRVFRARGAGRAEKRTAVIALARVLEHRRPVLKSKLASKDEGALFEIANRFDLRHRRADQLPDYDDAYLDWVFWWYLATIELTDRIMARAGV